MTVGDLNGIMLALALLAGNAFFVGAEFALISARRTQIEPSAASGSRMARLTLRAMENVSLMMAGAQLGITVCSLGLGAVGEPTVAHLLEGPFRALGVPDGLLHPIALVLALAVVVFLHMVLGEMVPKNIALAGPERSALLLGPLLYAVVWVLRPVIWLLNMAANVVLRMLRVEPKDEVTSAFNHEEVAGLIAESRREGLLGEGHQALLTGALAFDEQRVADVVIPLDQMVTVDRERTVAELERLCAETGFSRFPVLDDGEEIAGYLHMKDVLSVTGQGRDEPFDAKLVRPLASVRTEDSLREALSTMQRKGAHLARVVRPESDSASDAESDAESDAVVGLAALEDVLEEMVGEVRDAT